MEKIIKAGTKIVFRAECGVGTHTCEFYITTEDCDDKYLSDYAWELGVSHAEGYGVYLTEDGCEDDDGEYHADIEGWWELYDPEEHDGKRVGGDDFIEL